MIADELPPDLPPEEYAALAAEFHALTDPRDPPDPAEVEWDRARLARLDADAAETRRAIREDARRLGLDIVADAYPGAEDGRPTLAPVSTRRPSPAASRELVAGFIRPATPNLIASLEGLGKSGMRTELAIRGATGTGPLFGYFDIPAPFRVATFDEENGPDEELRRDRATLEALGLEQSALGDRYQRASFAGLNLNAPGDRA